MASYVNKIANTITNKTGSLIGRENLTRLTNSLNQSNKSKYRDYLTNGNVIQLISKTSHMSLQICASQNDPSRLILLGNGQIGPQFNHSHFIIEIVPSNGHLKFRNAQNYLAFDMEVPCILTPVLNPRTKRDEIRTRNEFRLHELFGDAEYFAIESVYYPGRYLAVYPDGSITYTKNKTEDISHFCLHVIQAATLIPQIYPAYNPLSNGTENPVPQQPSTSSQRNSVASAYNVPSEKQQESDMYAASTSAAAAAAAGSRSSAPPQATSIETPPAYQALFPKLPNM